MATQHACGCMSYADGSTWTCPAHLSLGERAPTLSDGAQAGSVPRSSNGRESGRLCHCDGPPHHYAPSWCGAGKF